MQNDDRLGIAKISIIFKYIGRKSFSARVKAAHSIQSLQKIVLFLALGVSFRGLEKRKRLRFAFQNKRYIFRLLFKNLIPAGKALVKTINSFRRRMASFEQIQ